MGIPPESVDREILGGRIIHAIKALRDASGCTIHEAMDFVEERRAELRRDRPSDFRLSSEEGGRDGRA
jgi:hypothetical protein